MQDIIEKGAEKNVSAGRLTTELTPLFDQESYCEKVEQVKHYIHEGDIFQLVLSNRLEAGFDGTALLANFYPFLSRDRMQEKEILTQSKRLFSGYRYEVRYTLSKDGAFYFNYFKEEMKKQGFVISDLSVSLKDGSFAPLPFTASGTVRYDFELEHYLSDYPKLYYTWHLEVV